MKLVGADALLAGAEKAHGLKPDMKRNVAALEKVLALESHIRWVVLSIL